MEEEKKENNKVIILTNETKQGKLTDADREVMNPDPDKCTTVTMEELMEMAKMAKMAKERMDGFTEEFVKIIDDVKAAFVKEIRCNQGYSWRAVAEKCYEEWNGDPQWWYPASNQLAGMAICEISQKLLGEEESYGWN